LLLFREPLKKEASTPSHLLARVQPHDSIELRNLLRHLLL
jgi:hypothetical protein